MQSQADKVIEAYRKKHPRARPGKKERKLIADRLAEGYTVEDLLAAIEGCHMSKFHRGDNDRNKKYQSLELIMRDSAHVQDFAEVYDDAMKAEKLKMRMEYEKDQERQLYRNRKSGQLN